MDFPKACQILEICNPQKAKEVLTEDMDLNMALHCRISVDTGGGKTKIGMMKPSATLNALSDSPALARVAQEVEEAIIEMIAEAKWPYPSGWSFVTATKGTFGGHGSLVKLPEFGIF